MPRNSIGALPRQDIVEAVRAGFLGGADITTSAQPASLVLPVTSEVYRVEGVTLPLLDEPVRDLISRINSERYDLKYPLEVGGTYLIKLSVSGDIPRGVYGFCNPKSTTGRHGAHSRIIADGVQRFDALYPKGFRGELWNSVVPHAHPLVLHEGVPLSQLRLFTDNTRLDELQLQFEMQQHRLLWSRRGVPLEYADLRLTDKDGSIILTADFDSRILGFESVGSRVPIDFSKRGYDPREYFREVEAINGSLHLRAGRFYILSTAEFVRVPPHLACEMRPMDDRSGEFRTHYAGFIDPGWGWGKNGRAKGRPLTLEVRPVEDIIIFPRQPIAKIKFEHMRSTPDVLYDDGASNYSKQRGPKLAKHFGSW